MGYEPIKVIAWAETDLNGHVNRVTEFDETSQSNKLSYRDGFPHITCVPNGQDTRGPRLVDYNGLFYLFSSFLFQQQMGNYPTYNANVVGAGKPLPNGYPQGAVLWYAAGGYFVKSIVDNNTESDLTNPTYWEKITISAADLASGLSGKVDLATGVAQADVDYVIESYINGASWYRVYKSGWCEQGGLTNVSLGSGYCSISFLQEFANTNYCFMCHPEAGNLNNVPSDNLGIYRGTGTVYSRSTDGVQVYYDADSVTGNFCWRAEGYLTQGD